MVLPRLPGHRRAGLVTPGDPRLGRLPRPAGRPGPALDDGRDHLPPRARDPLADRTGHPGTAQRPTNRHRHALTSDADPDRSTPTLLTQVGTGPVAWICRVVGVASSGGPGHPDGGIAGQVGSLYLARHREHPGREARPPPGTTGQATRRPGTPARPPRLHRLARPSTTTATPRTARTPQPADPLHAEHQPGSVGRVGGMSPPPRTVTPCPDADPPCGSPGTLNFPRTATHPPVECRAGYPRRRGARHHAYRSDP